ncbi:exportin-7-like [Schistocerca gregaria]|uniref:exportin-7-like n=1 Tax=Schistocerca gregaria TaxID=7010 RepID=UPI00211F3198|nr:exportin-7-like [Schistocerca gregaria]
MNPEEMQYIEKVVEQAYSSHDPGCREEIFKIREQISNIENMKPMLWFLSQTQSYMSFYFVCGQITSVFTEYSNSLDGPSRKELRQMLSVVLFERYEWLCDTVKGDVSKIARDSLAQLLARVYHVCWFEFSFNLNRSRAQEPELLEVGSDDIVTELLRLIDEIRFRREDTSKLELGDDVMSNGGDLNAKNQQNLTSDETMLHLIAIKMIIDENSTLASTLMGCTILNSLILEMGIPMPRQPSYWVPKTSKSFCDTCLLDIFKTTVSTTQKLLDTNVPMTEPEQSQHKFLLHMVLTLAQSVFSFESIESPSGELADAPRILHVPRSWKSVFQTPTILQTYFQCYTQLQPPLSTYTLEILSSIVSINCSVFGTQNDQTVFLSNLFEIIWKILQSKQGLDDPNNRHHLCRLTVCLNWNFELNTISSVPLWKNFVTLLAEFHFQVMESPDCNPKIIYYIMIWWSRFYNSTFYMSSGIDSSFLLDIFPAITIGFIKTQLKQQENILPSSDQDILESEQLKTILPTIPVLVDCPRKVEIYTYLLELLTQLGLQFSTLDQHSPRNVIESIERQLAFIIHIVTVIYRREDVSIVIYNEHRRHQQEDESVREQLDSLNANLVSSVFNIWRIHDERLIEYDVSVGLYYLEYALTCFLKRFSIFYFKNDASKSQMVNYTLSQQHGLTDVYQVLEAILGKISSNLKNWPSGSPVSLETLQLFWILGNGPVSSGFCSKTEFFKHLLSHHTEINLGGSSRNRFEFYHLLGKLAFRNLDIDTIYMFLGPFEEKLVQLGRQLEDAKFYNSESTVEALIQLLGDVRAVSQSCSKQQSYAIFFEWIYPSGFFRTICISTVQRYAQTEWRVVWSVLKFVREFASDTNERIRFPSINPDGHQFFRDTAELLLLVASNVSNLLNAAPCAPVAPHTELAPFNNRSGKTQLNPIDMCFKSVLLFLHASCSVLEGAPFYANLGVFQLYGYKIVSELVHAVFNIIYSINMDDIESYPKLTELVYRTLEVICLHYLNELLSPELSTSSNALTTTLLFFKRGLLTNSFKILCSCSHSVYKLALTQYQNSHQRIRRGNPTIISLDSYHREILTCILFELFDIMLLQYDRLHAIVGQAAFYLTQLLPEEYAIVKNIFIKSQSQNPSKAEAIETQFRNLMEGIDNTAIIESKDQFIINALDFRSRCESIIDSYSLYKEARNTLRDFFK